MPRSLKTMIRAQDAKAFDAHPVLLDRDPQITVRQQGVDRTKRAAFGQREAHRHLQAYGGRSDAIDWVMDCIRLIAETASDAAWHFEKEGNKLVNHRAENTPAELKDAPPLAVKLFEEPNPFMDWHELMELSIIDYLLVGNAYWFKWRTNEAGQPLALYRLSPAHVKVIPGQWGIEGYEYRLPGMDKPMLIKPENIVHFKQANPHSPYYGMGIIQGGSRALDLELALTDTQASYFEKHAQPSMIVQSERRVPDAVFKKLKTQLRAFYSGPKNAGSLMVLEAGLKYQAVSPSAAEAAFETLSKLSRDRILAMFRVPAVLLGIIETGDTKINDAQRIFDNKTMRPILDKFQTAITRGVTSNWDIDFLIDYEYIMPPEEKLKLVQNFGAIPGVTIREVREYAGLEPIGDETDDIVLNLPGEDAGEGEHPDVADKNLGSEAGRPPLPQNTRAFPKPGQPLPKGAAARRSTTTKSISERMKDLEHKAVTLERDYRTDLDQRIKAPADTLEQARTVEVNALVADLQEELAQAAYDLERALLDHVEGKAKGTIYQRIKKSDAWKAFKERITAALERAATSAVSTAVQQQASIGFQPDEEIDYEDIVKSLIYRADGGVASISKTLQDEIAEKVLAIQRRGGDRKELDTAIRESIVFWRETQSETVALTEAVHAYNEATLVAAEATGVTHVAVSDGDDHDQPCLDANGSIWTIEEARANRLEHPRCRRAFVPIRQTTG